MLKAMQSQRRALECLRLEADCRQLARDSDSLGLREHFLWMAQVWFAMAVSGSRAYAAEGVCETKSRSV
jgi:hypothetical protein